MGFLLFGFGRYLDPPFPLSLPVVGKIEELMTIREVCDRHGRDQIFAIHLIRRTH